MTSSSSWAISRKSLSSSVPRLFIAHSILELILGSIKLRGRYEDQPAAGPEAKFIRHHGVSLVSLALLGALVWWKRLIETETGRLASCVLCFFHAAASAVHAHALFSGSTKSASTLAMHLPFALAFLFDATRTRKQAAGDNNKR